MELIKRLLNNEVRLKRDSDTITVRLRYGDEIPVQINKYDTVSKLRNVVSTGNFGIYMFIPKDKYISHPNDDILENNGGIYKSLDVELSLDEQGVKNGTILLLSAHPYAIHLFYILIIFRNKIII